VSDSSPSPDAVNEQIRSHNAAIVARAVWTLVGLAFLVILICTLVKGRTGFIGSLLGVLLVTVFFGADAVALRLTRRSQPGTIVGIVLLLYVTKLILLLIALKLVKDSVAFDAPSLIAAVIIGALATGAAAMRLWSTMHVQYVDP
jgi:ATP synthase protein I